MKIMFPIGNALLFVVLLVLKLAGVITLSWGWVTAPIWFPFVVALVVLTVELAVAAVQGAKRS